MNIQLVFLFKLKKAYSDWKISKVLKKFLHQDGISIGNILTFKIGIVFYLKNVIWYFSFLYDFSEPQKIYK
ncbi:hypothetical protein GLOIN_2v643587 [Rhizophagus irregularis DAOM 181602=DAOM 197198]|nr:hypothetical protein RhiirB3_445959 [Rhizophagus irregularis]GET56527.1 hypothetical protein GLOIN_2v643587 [Rhizophagus irregularis DAOM 181602=DAOM 197198]